MPNSHPQSTYNYEFLTSQKYCAKIWFRWHALFPRFIINWLPLLIIYHFVTAREKNGIQYKNMRNVLPRLGSSLRAMRYALQGTNSLLMLRPNTDQITNCYQLYLLLQKQRAPAKLEHDMKKTSQGSYILQNVKYMNSSVSLGGVRCWLKGPSF